MRLRAATAPWKLICVTLQSYRRTLGERRSFSGGLRDAQIRRCLGDASGLSDHEEHAQQIQIKFDRMTTLHETVGAIADLVKKGHVRAALR